MTIPVKVEGEEDQDDRLIAVAVVEGVPQMSHMVEGRLRNLDDFDEIGLIDYEAADGTMTIVPMDDFIKTYMPTRLLFRNAGHG